MPRSLSMFQHPDDVMRAEQQLYQQHMSLGSIMDIDQVPEPRIPYFTSIDDPDGLPRITQETMVEVLNHRYSSQFENIKVIDCRFEYEYAGGHIENAVNFNDKQQLANELFNTPQSSSTLLIFHCEYSVHRAPRTAKFIRGHDRSVNVANYPFLTYPDVYILEGGYSKFYASHLSRCFPQNYVEMSDQRHEQSCERGMAKVKTQGRQKLFRSHTYAFGQSNDVEVGDSPSAQRRVRMVAQSQKLFRNQTFAFGQLGQDDVGESPTAQRRVRIKLGERSQTCYGLSADVTESIGQSFARRMALY